MAQTSVLRILGQAAVIVTVGAAFGLAANAMRPTGLPLDRPVLAAAEQADATCALPEPAAGVVEYLDVLEAQPLLARGVPFVDTRDGLDYAIGHVTGALHLPQGDACPDAGEVLLRIGLADQVVIYDDGRSGDARQLAHALAAEGHGRIRLLRGGFPVWAGASQSGMCEACGVQPASEERR